jgi:hypothetical protein
VRRGVIDVLRRGGDNTIANWPLILIRLAETLLFGILAVVTIFVALVPIFVSIGIELSKLTTPDDLAEAAFALMSRWILLVWVFVAITVLTIIFVAMHAFVEAGSARVYVDAERAAGPAMLGPRARFRTFTMDRWLSGATDGWWTVFWIYNLGWGLAGLILLIPLVPTLAFLLIFREEPGAALAIGCMGLMLTALFLIVVGIVTGMWVNRALNEWAAHSLGARASLSTAWSAIRLDLARHVLVLLAIIVVGLAGSSFFASFSFFAAFGDAMGGSQGSIFNLFTMPLRLVGSFLSSAFSAAVSAWYLASYSALATE